jgi:hypothetical protein
MPSGPSWAESVGRRYRRLDSRRPHRGIDAWLGAVVEIDGAGRELPVKRTVPTKTDQLS